MKIRIIILFSLTTILLISCKNNNSEKTNNQTTDNVVVDDSFKVTLEVLVKKNDDLQVYYTESPSETFSEEKSVWKEVKGSETAQKIVFDLPKDIVPNSLRLDFGLNKDQDDITFLSFEMDYIGRKFSSKGLDLENYFRPLEPTKINFETGIINAIDNNKVRVEPVLYPHEISIGREIDKLVK